MLHFLVSWVAVALSWLDDGTRSLGGYSGPHILPAPVPVDLDEEQDHAPAREVLPVTRPPIGTRLIRVGGEWFNLPTTWTCKQIPCCRGWLEFDPSSGEYDRSGVVVLA